MADQKILEGKFQWPTRGEVILFKVAGSMPFLLGIFILLVLKEPAGFLLGFGMGSPFLFVFPVSILTKKVRKSSFADVYPDRVEVGSTFFRTHLSRIEASKIESVSFSQSVLGKSDYGNIIIGGSGGMKLRVVNLIDPEAFVLAVRGISSAPVQKNTPAASGSAAQEIAELNALLQAGVISQEDFEKGKNKALGL